MTLIAFFLACAFHHTDVAYLDAIPPLPTVIYGEVRGSYRAMLYPPDTIRLEQPTSTDTGKVLLGHKMAHYIQYCDGVRKFSPYHHAEGWRVGYACLAEWEFRG